VQLVPEQRLQNPWKKRLKSQKKDGTHRKQTEVREKASSCPQPTHIYTPSMMSMVWNISISQPGLAAWLRSLPAPVQLLFSQTWETENSLTS